MKRVLVTGAGGFVGRHALRALAAKVAPRDRLAAIGRAPMTGIPAEVETREIDLLDTASLAAFLATFRPTHVLHLAAVSSVQQAAGSPAETWRVNLVGLLNLVEALAGEAPGATFLFVSSGEVYGRAFLTGSPLAEDVVPQPVSAYARTKLAGEMMLADLLPAAGIKLIVLRPFNHVGPGQNERFVLASFAGQIARIEAGQSPAVIEVGDLSAARDFLDVRDVVAVYAALIARSDAVGDRTLYNVSSGVSRRTGDILAEMRALARVPVDVQVSPGRLRRSEIPTASGDSSALTAAIGWRPAVPWAETLQAIMQDARDRVGVG